MLRYHSQKLSVQVPGQLAVKAGPLDPIESFHPSVLV